MEPPSIAPRTILEKALLDSRSPGAAPVRVDLAATINAAPCRTPRDHPKQAFGAVVSRNLLAMPCDHAHVMSASGGLEMGNVETGGPTDAIPAQDFESFACVP